MTARPNAPRPNVPPRVPRAPESTGKLDSAETNPLPNMSSAKAWTSLEAEAKRASKPSFPALPKATPIIREKSPTPSRYIRADGTEEIRASDIMIVVPKASPPQRRPVPRPQANSTGELDAGDILSAEPVGEDIQIDVEEPVFRPPAFSIHATQEILADDVLEVQAAAAKLPAPAPVPAAAQFVLQLPASLAPHLQPHQPPPQLQPQPQAQPQLQAQPVAQQQGREEAPSAPPPPWTIDAADEFDFPTKQPVMSGPYPALSSGPRLTNFSATEVFRRRSHGMKVVVASVTFAAAVMAVAGVAKLSPALAAGSEPVGIAMHTPKSLDRSVRTRDRVVGFAPKMASAVTVSIDDLAPVHHRRR